VVYAYAIAESLREPPGGTGLDGTPLRVVAADGLAAVVSDRDDAQLTVSEDSLWAHERIIERLMEEQAVLPMRFGSVLAGDDAVEAMLSERQAELSEGLRRVRGAVELGVRIAWDEDAVQRPEPDGASGPGTAYLMALSRARRRAGELAERVDRSVAGLARARVQRRLASPSLPVSAAYLVDRANVEEFRARIAELGSELSGVDLVCTGPWPPYSFAEGLRA
jgi:hypothetical protein